MVLSMERWVGKVAVVTGASAGIGEAIVKQLVKNGMIVAGLARRNEKVAEIGQTLKEAKGKLFAVKCDVSKEEDILKAFKWILENLGPVQVLINNAGILLPTSLADGDTEKWRKQFDVNVLGPCIAAREAIRIMKSNQIEGHIVQMNSVAGQSIPKICDLNVYSGTKHALRAISETLRFELLKEEFAIKITNIYPGATATEIIKADGMENLELNQAFTKHKILDGEDVADAVLYALSTPPHVSIKEITIQPVREEY